jgi:hypothetical protein
MKYLPEQVIIMNSLLKQLYKNNKSQMLVFIVVSVINLVVVGVFSKIIGEIYQIKLETERISRDEQLTMYFYLLIAISVMIILFSLWILRIVIKTIFSTRKEFNIQLRLSGVTRKQLSYIYVKESIYYQFYAVPIALVLMEIIYTLLSDILDIQSKWIGVANIIGALILHIFIITLCMLVTLKKIASFDPLEEMRSPYKTDTIKKLETKDWAVGIVGFVLIICGLFMGKDNGMLAVLPIAGGFLLLDIIEIGIQHLLLKIGELFGLKSLVLSQRIFMGYFKRTNPIISTLVVGVMLSAGLIGMFTTMRNIAKDTVEENMFFNHLIIHSSVIKQRSEEEYRDLVSKLDPDAQIAYGINLEMVDSEGYENTIYSIDSDYGKYGEKMVLTDGSDPSVSLNDPTFSGIYLPNYFISDDDIGEKYVLQINNHKVEFTIAGRFVANGSRGRYGFVSKGYMQSQIEIDMINALYIHKANDSVIEALNNDSNVTGNYVVTKQEIADNSYENAINGVEIFEISAFLVILVSFLMLVHFYISVSNQNVFDITRFRAMGANVNTLKRAYLFQMMNVITIATVIGILLAKTFIGMGVDMSLEFITVPVRTTFPITLMLFVYVLLLIGGSLILHLTIKRAFTSDIRKYLTISE